MVPKWCPDVKNDFVKRKTAAIPRYAKSLDLQGFSRVSYKKLCGNTAQFWAFHDPRNAARLDQILQSPALDIERIYFETPEQAEALSLAQKIPIMTLAFPSEKDCFSVALLKEVPSVKLGMIFRKKDQAELEPLLNYFRAYFIRHQQDFLPLKPLISNMTA